MRKRSFTWRDNLYTLDQATLTQWPHARLIKSPDTDVGLRMAPTPELFVKFASNLQCAIDDGAPLAQQWTEARSALLNLGYAVWSVPEVVEHILESPDIDLAAELVAGLEHWFFYQKIEKWKPPTSVE